MDRGVGGERAILIERGGYHVKESGSQRRGWVRSVE